jgi:hypothetical protein
MERCQVRLGMRDEMMRYRSRRVARALGGGLFILCLLAPLAAEAQKAPPAIDQEAINKAVEKGAKWILEKINEEVPRYYNSYVRMAGANQKHHDPNTVDELALYALLHSGVDPKHPEVVKLLDSITTRTFERTYVTAIRAQAFHKYDPVLLKDHIRNAAQFLIDNQSQQGYWGYGKAIKLPTVSRAEVTPDPKMTYSGPRGSSSSDDDPFMKSAKPGWGRGNTTSRPRIQLSRQGWGQATDNSNSQYAILGLAACMAAGYAPPSDLLSLSERWWTVQQNADGGWNYRNHQPTQQTAPGTVNRPSRVMKSYLSMTAGGVSSLCIILRAKGATQPELDRRVQAGIQWLAKNLDFGGNNLSLGGSSHRYYAIYSVERAGALANTDWFGDKAWFKEGADWLLANQRKDGSWGGIELQPAVAARQQAAQPQFNDDGRRIADTAWALLFLRRATRGITKTLSPDFHKAPPQTRAVATPPPPVEAPRADEKKTPPEDPAKAAPAEEEMTPAADEPKAPPPDPPASPAMDPPALPAPDPPERKETPAQEPEDCGRVTP